VNRGIFADEGISGTGTAKRVEFNKMIEECKRGTVDLIITKSISRFARNTLDCLKAVRYLKDIDVGVYFERENINTKGVDSELILSILSSIAQDESRNISENVKWGFQKRFKDGKIQINTKRFLGYDLNDKGELVINKKEAKIVKRIFDEYLSGKSLNDIKKGLEKDKIRTVTGNSKWHSNSIKYILKNEKYCGDLILQKTVIVNYLTQKKKRNEGEVPIYKFENHHEPIVSKEDFSRVQEIMENRAKEYGNIPGNRSKYGRRYVFSGKIYCGVCGAVFKRRTWNSKSKNKQIVWQCSSYINEGKSFCSMKAVDDVTLKAVFVRVFNKIYDDKEHIFKTFIKNIEKVLKEDEKYGDALKIHREIESVYKNIRVFVRKQIQGEIDEETFNKSYEILDRRLKELKERKEKLDYDKKNLEEIMERTDKITAFIKEKGMALTEFDDAVFENLVEQIIVITPTHLKFCLKNGFCVEEKFIKKRGIKGLV
jgi:site-specific DNA recombinase